MVAQKRKSAEVDVADIRKVYSLFVDVKRSTQFLKEFEQEFMFSDNVTHYEGKKDQAMTAAWDKNKIKNFRLQGKHILILTSLFFLI